MPSYALLVDYKYCTGCHSCEIACNQEYNLPLGASGIKVLESVMKHREKYYVNFMPVRTDLCSLCVRRIKKGKQASCVQHCLANCLKIIDRKELAVDLAKENRRQMLFI